MLNRDYRRMSLDDLFIIKRRLERIKNPTKKDLEERKTVENELARRILLDD